MHNFFKFLFTLNNSTINFPHAFKLILFKIKSVKFEWNLIPLKINLIPFNDICLSSLKSKWIKVWFFNNNWFKKYIQEFDKLFLLIFKYLIRLSINPDAIDIKTLSSRYAPLKLTQRILKFSLNKFLKNFHPMKFLSILLK